MSDSHNALNSAQIKASGIINGPVLVIAGAGTGKTRTIVFRLAKMVESGIKPNSILLLTFTRRAAREMISRAAGLVGDRCHEIAGGTFHSFAHLMLRRYGDFIDLRRDFTIMDQADTLELIGSIRSEMNFGRSRGFPRRETIGAIISKAVNRQADVEDVLTSEYIQFLKELSILTEIKSRYEAYKLERALLDFDDLLCYLIRLLTESDDALRIVTGRHPYVMVDEYQDTNFLQASITRLLAGERKNVMVVGDEAQSIYAFRGANYTNLFDFKVELGDVQLVKLEENYRSTQPILDVSNGLLNQMSKSFRKRLFTARHGGEKPTLVVVRDENEQARYVTGEIENLISAGMDPSEIAVLFRASFQSYQIELELNRRSIPFVKYGGFKFIEAAHLKDVTSHLRVLHNNHDHISFQRILLLCEGVGPATARRIEETANGKPVIDVLREYIDRPKSKSSVAELYHVLLDLYDNRYSPAEALEKVIEYYEPIMKLRYDDWPKRKRDLQQLVAVGRNYRSYTAMLSDMAIDPPTISQQDTILLDEPKYNLVLSTVHSAKGLEWKVVIVIHVINGSFPMFGSSDGNHVSPDKLDEELRLLYVAVTRAKDRLFLVAPQYTARKPSYVWSYESPFIQALPHELFQLVKPSRSIYHHMYR